MPDLLCEVPARKSTAKCSTRYGARRHKTYSERELRPKNAANAQELSHPTVTDDATYSPQNKPETRPPQAAKRGKRKRTTSFLSKAFKGLREAFLNYVAPAYGGTAFIRKERQKSTIAEILHNDPGPWHEYGRLDSDTEDDKYNSRRP
ncbi:hypothetical protein GGR58DRAFT_500213 [Xylaria digitata]|nr:hypothetical protein GGR58DRAFT_500213 [Xylaria digitata]